jgi:hypothetical protein
MIKTDMHKNMEKLNHKIPCFLTSLHQQIKYKQALKIIKS